MYDSTRQKALIFIGKDIIFEDKIAGYKRRLPEFK